MVEHIIIVHYPTDESVGFRISPMCTSTTLKH